MTSQRIQVRDGIELCYEELGSGARPFVLVHGFTGFRQDFATQWGALSELGRTLVPDLPGHGESTHLGENGSEGDEGYDLKTLSANLVEFLRGLDLPPVDLLGHSMGGMLVLRAALAAPERVASLVLMNTSAEPLRDVDEEEAALAGRIAREAGTSTLARIARERSAGDQSRSAADRQVEQDWGAERFWAWRTARLEKMDAFAIEKLASAMRTADSLVPRLAEISCPTTVMVGTEDHGFLEPSETLAREILGSRRAWIPGAAHQPQHEQPDAWLAAIQQHLDDVRS